MPVLPSTRPADPSPSRWPGPLTFVIPTGILFALGWLTWQPIPVGVWHDDGAYVLIAESLARDGSLSWFGVSGTPPAAKFPPLFPALLALILRAGVDPGSGAATFALLNTGLLALSGGVFALFLRRALGLGPVWAGGLATLLWFSPRLWALAALPLSEPLFLLTLSLALWASTGLEPRTQGAHPDKPPPTGPGTVVTLLAGVAFLVAFGLAFYTRTVGLALSLAMIGACAVRGARRRAVWIAVGSLGLVLPWIRWSAAASERIPEPMRDVLGGYGGWLVQELARDPLAFGVSAFANGWASWMALSEMILPGLSDATFLQAPVSFALAVAAAVGLIRLRRHSLTAAFVVVVYLAIVAVWPFRAPRLLVPVLPLTGLALFLAFRPSVPVDLAKGGRVPPRDATDLWVRRALIGLGVVVALNYAARSAADLVAGNHLLGYQRRAEALAAVVQSIEEFTPPDAVVGAPELWAGLQIHANRVVAPSARFLPLATEGPSWGTPEQQFALWAAADLDFIVVEHAGGVHGEALDRLDAECPGGAVQLVATLPTGFLVRLAWDEQCRRRLLSP